MKWRMKAGQKEATSSAVEIDAFKWTVDLPSPTYPDWMLDKIETGEITLVDAGTPQVSMVFQTFDGTMVARPGDWIVLAPNGEVYPAQARLFENKFEIAA
jgi:hypothetical protein